MQAEHVHTISLTAAFIAGIAGSAHCLAMCGGMAGALGVRARTVSADARDAFVQAALYQAGRIGGYVLAGAVIGALGAATLQALNVAQLGLALRIASGVFIALVGARLLFRWNPLAWIERWGAIFWRRLRPFAQRAAQRASPQRAIALGFLWGWLPCGLVYSMLLFAGMSGSSCSGAGIMLAFGIGTLPSMLTSSLFASQLQRLMSRRWPKILSGSVLIAFGAWMMLAAWGMAAGQHAHIS